MSLGRFHDALAAEFKSLAADNVLDFGCGEGFVLDELAARGVDLDGYEGLDLRADAVAQAQSRWPGKKFTTANIFDAAFDGKKYDAVMALEVLEHLYEPAEVLKRLVSLTRGTLILTVPHEPWFQLVNLARGRDLIRLGNHPEHVQHWNPSSFAEFVSREAEIINIKRSFPFIIATARPR